MPFPLWTRHFALAFLTGLGMPATVMAAATAQVVLPLGRAVYQTNEWIDVSVVRGGSEPLAAGDLVLSTTGADGSKLVFTFPVKAATVSNGRVQATEHLHLNGALLRPGKYTVEAAVDRAKALTSLEVFSHLRKSDFRLINWGRAKDKEQLVQGEDSLGFNLFYGANGLDSDAAGFIPAGVDFMSNCTM